MPKSLWCINLFTDSARSSLPSLPPTPIHKQEVMTFQAFSESAVLDEFSASLQMSDEDRRHDAWIPSEETKNILINMATSPPGTYLPSNEQLCLPTLVVTESQVCSVPDRFLVYCNRAGYHQKKVPVLPYHNIKCLIRSCIMIL